MQIESKMAITISISKWVVLATFSKERSFSLDYRY